MVYIDYPLEMVVPAFLVLNDHLSEIGQVAFLVFFYYPFHIDTANVFCLIENQNCGWEGCDSH